jgi:hypothetical protein
MNLSEPYAYNLYTNNFFYISEFNSAFQKCVLNFARGHNNSGRKFDGYCGNFIQMSFELGKPTSATYAFKIAFYKNDLLEEEQKIVTFRISGLPGAEWTTIME